MPGVCRCDNDYIAIGNHRAPSRELSDSLDGTHPLGCRRIDPADETNDASNFDASVALEKTSVVGNPISQPIYGFQVGGNDAPIYLGVVAEDESECVAPELVVDV